jgi:NADH dehydrogenase
MAAPLTRNRHGGSPRVVIVGSGFGGLAAVRVLGDRPRKRTGVQVTLVDRHNHHVFTPFLYQVATAILEPSSAARPVRALIRGLPNVEFRLAQVTGINFSLHRLESDRGPIGYDYLIVAAGAVNDSRHHAGVAAHSFGLGDLGAAEELRNHILSCFEAATWATDPAERARQLTFAVVGGGSSGVEFAAALSVLVAEMMRCDYPTILNLKPSIIVIERAKALLPSFTPDLQDKATRTLRTKGVRVETGVPVVDADADGLSLEDGRRIETATAVWAAGVRANSLAACFPATGSRGRIIVRPALQIDRHPEVFVVGDIAEIPGQEGALPMLAQVAVQSGRHAARSVLALSKGGTATTFRYRDFGTMSVLGRGDAVAQIGRVHLSGLSGWLAWLGVHLARTTGLQIKASVLLNCVSGFVCANCHSRLIAGPTTPNAREREAHPPGPKSATARVSVPPVRADLPSVNVANAGRFGRVAALAWWSQDYPGRRLQRNARHRDHISAPYASW